MTFDFIFYILCCLLLLYVACCMSYIVLLLSAYALHQVNNTLYSLGLTIRNDASLYTYLQSTGHNTTQDTVLGYTQFIGWCVCVFHGDLLIFAVTPSHAQRCVCMHTYRNSYIHMHLLKYIHIHQIRTYR